MRLLTRLVPLSLILHLSSPPSCFCFSAGIDGGRSRTKSGAPPIPRSAIEPAQLPVPTAAMKATSTEASSPRVDDDCYDPQSQSPTTASPPLFDPSSHFGGGLRLRRRWLVVDFDGTCTDHDTTPLLPRLASFVSRRSSNSQYSPTSSSSLEEKMVGDDEPISSPSPINHSADLECRLSEFQKLEDEYMKRIGEVQSSLWKRLDERDDGGLGVIATGQREGDTKAIPDLSIYDALHALDEPSTIVTHMVSDSGVLRGLGNADTSDIEAALIRCRDDDDDGHADGGAVSPRSMATAEGGGDDEETQNGGTDIRAEEDGGKVRVRLRPGCEGTLARTLLTRSSAESLDDGDANRPSSSCLGWSLAVLSINWCPALIDASLVRPVLRRRRAMLFQGESLGADAVGERSRRQPHGCEDLEIPIWSNRVDGEGVVALHVPGALAKRDRIAELKRHLSESDDGGGCGNDDEVGSDSQLQTASGLGGEEDGEKICVSNKSTRVDSSIVIYVGDSSTDLAALLEADVGILMGESRSTLLLAERWGIQITPLRHRVPGAWCSGREERRVGVNVKGLRLWQTDSWTEIDALLQDIDATWDSIKK